VDTIALTSDLPAAGVGGAAWAIMETSDISPATEVRGGKSSGMTARRDPARYVSTVRRPADFERFWEGVLAEADPIPLNPSLERIPLRSTPEVDVHRLEYDSLDGLRIGGWYCVPTAAHIPPPYPALLLMPGYVSDPTLPKSWARMGYAAVGVAPRGKIGSNQRYNPGYPGLLVDNIVDRETYAYRGFYVDAVRAVDFVRQRPEVDPTRVGVHGSSQGGALTVVTAALRHHAVTCGAAGAPYLCGFMDAARLTRSYPYQEITEYLRAHPDQHQQVTQTVAYFDGVCFAPMITAPMLVYIGLEDDVCPPETGYALHDALTCPKQLIATPRAAHDAGAYWVDAKVKEFLAAHLQPAGGQA
jgi:cephalosporin-C deacetylase